MFGLEDMKKIVYGGLVREKETGAFTFSRMTVKQYGYFTREEDARFLVRMGCTAGICMDFYTDSGSLEFDYEISGMSDRDIVQLISARTASEQEALHRNRERIQSAVSIIGLTGTATAGTALQYGFLI